MEPTPGHIDASFQVAFTTRLRFTHGVFEDANRVLASVLEPPGDGRARVLAAVDSGVAEAWPTLLSQVERWAARARIELGGPPVIVPGGERAKNDPEPLDRLVGAIHDAGLCRRSYLMAIGGGAVLDVAGYAAATAHRGIRIVRLPTTTLSQDDSGVGVKNGVNRFGKKNYLGTFAVPWAVVCDEAFLSTLSDRDWRSGLSEAVKVGLVKDAALFERIERDAARLARREGDAARPVIRRSAELHLRHITEGGDPFELTRARPLDFGHWAAHRLEHLSGYRLRHGEAVAIGIALDAEYSRLSGWLEAGAAERVISCLRGVGLRLWDEAAEGAGSLLEGIGEFREHLGGELSVPMLRGVGDSFDVHEIDRDRMLGALASLREREKTPESHDEPLHRRSA